MTTIATIRPVTAEAPRGAAVAAGVADHLRRLLGAWRTRQAERQQRDARINEANAVRRIADRLYALDPRAATDLYAAADRHELL